MLQFNPVTSLQLLGSFPGLPSGSWEVQAFVYGLGYAMAQLPVIVSVTLGLEGIFPPTGGVLGGTAVGIHGRGVDSTNTSNNR